MIVWLKCVFVGRERFGAPEASYFFGKRVWKNEFPIFTNKFPNFCIFKSFFDGVLITSKKSVRVSSTCVGDFVHRNPVVVHEEHKDTRSGKTTLCQSPGEDFSTTPALTGTSGPWRIRHDVEPVCAECARAARAAPRCAQRKGLHANHNKRMRKPERWKHRQVRVQLSAISSGETSCGAHSHACDVLAHGGARAVRTTAVTSSQRLN